LYEKTAKKKSMAISNIIKAAPRLTVARIIFLGKKFYAILLI
jgi:hypothetical protein